MFQKPIPILAGHILSKWLFPSAADAVMKNRAAWPYAKNLAAAVRGNLKRCDRRSLRSNTKFPSFQINNES